jgi:hypothetical protein
VFISTVVETVLQPTRLWLKDFLKKLADSSTSLCCVFTTG